MRLLRRLWRDDRAEVSSLATILLYTIIGLGVTVGVVELRNQIVKEYGDVAAALEHLNQSYGTFVDDVDDSSHFQDPAGGTPAGLNVRKAPGDEGDVLTYP